MFSSPAESMENKILLIRSLKVVLDTDLAALYGVTTKRLNEQVKRNRERFPEDFMFRFTKSEKGRGGRKLRPPRVVQTFTGAFLRTHRARRNHGGHGAQLVARDRGVSLHRARFRAVAIASNKELAAKLNELERRLERRLDTDDQAIRQFMAAIRELMTPAEPKKRPIGFVTSEEKKSESPIRRRRRASEPCGAYLLNIHFGLRVRSSLTQMIALRNDQPDFRWQYFDSCGAAPR